MDGDSDDLEPFCTLEGKHVMVETTPMIEDEATVTEDDGTMIGNDDDPRMLKPICIMWQGESWTEDKHCLLRYSCLPVHAHRRRIMMCV